MKLRDHCERTPMTALPRPISFVFRAADYLWHRVTVLHLLIACWIAFAAALVLVVELALSLHAVGG